MSISNGSDREFQKALMENGFFPENVPPVFKVQNFFKVSDELGLLDSFQITKPTKLSKYNATKRGGQRRIFSTPNPLFFLDAASFFTKYRGQLDGCWNTDYSCSIPTFDNNNTNRNDRFVKILSHTEFVRKRREKLASSRYIVKADILRFFSSIYTHSIPWAVHGKDKSKEGLKRRSTKIFTNKLDYIIRQAQDRQTIGIPVGPDTSKIISELIAGAVDAEFRQQVGSGVVGIRLVDDIYLGANSHEEAEKLLSAYQQALRHYELEINENKSIILDTRYDLEPFWPVEIRRELAQLGTPFMRHERKVSDLTLYLDEIIRKANQLGDDGLIKYAIRMIDRQHLWKGYWDAIEVFLIRSVVIFPHCVDFVARVVVWYSYLETIDKDKWEDVCQKIISHHAPLGNDSEVVWTCWLLKEIKAKISSNICKEIIAHCGPFSVLLVLDMYSAGLVDGRFPKKLINERLSEQSMQESDWLLLYEAERSFNFKMKREDGSLLEVYKELLSGDVQFYNPYTPPVVFEGIDEEDFDTVAEAIEDSDGFYEADEDDEMWTPSIALDFGD